jgi:hypothetical protein
VRGRDIPFWFLRWFGDSGVFVLLWMCEHCVGNEFMVERLELCIAHAIEGNI